MIIIISDFPNAQRILDNEGIEAEVLPFPELPAPPKGYYEPMILAQYYTKQALDREIKVREGRGEKNFTLVAIKFIPERGTTPLRTPNKIEPPQDMPKSQLIRESIERQSGQMVEIGISVHGVCMRTHNSKSSLSKTLIEFDQFDTHFIDELAQDEEACQVPGALHFVGPRIDQFRKHIKQVATPRQSSDEPLTLEDLSSLPIKTIRRVIQEVESTPQQEQATAVI